jgi:Zn-dependent peptidase ImmA (M78 family)
MAKTLRINPGIVEWALSRTGQSAGDLVGDFPRIEEWLAGEGGPTFPQLERLAQKLCLPTAIFFSPQKPNLPDPTQSFRSLPASMRARIPQRVMRVILAAQAYQFSLAELYGSKNSSLNLSLLESIALQKGAKRSAAAAREILGCSVEEQLGWNGGVDAALKKWRDLVTENGIFVFAGALQSEEISGFCLYDEQYPVILLNNSHAKSRQIFTIFHELAHIGLGLGGIDSPSVVSDMEQGQNRVIEKFCDSFSAEFVAPLSVVSDLLGKVGDIDASVSQVAERLKVSRAVILSKALEAGKISKADYDGLISKYLSVRRAKKSGQSGNYYNNIKTYVGPRYLNRVFDLYESNKITDEDASRFLRIAPKSLDGLRPNPLE